MRLFDDGASNLNVYVGDDERIHFTNWAGADSVLPFNSGLSLTDLGTGTSFDVSSYSGFGNFTVDNFFISSITDKSVSFSKTGSDYSGSHTSTTSGSISFTKSYNNSTGVLSCYCTVSCSHSGSHPNHNGSTSQITTVHVYLAI